MTARQDFANYCLRKLGAPLLNIEIHDDQIEDCIKEAIEYYHEYHNDGIERDIVKHQITQTDKTNQYIDLPEGIVGIIKIIPFSGVFSGNYLFSGQYQFFLSELNFLKNYNLSNYYTTKQYLETAEFVLGSNPQFRFNRRMNKLYLDTNWDNINVDDYLVLEVYRELNPDTYSSIYKDRWLKKYCVALMKYQWGTNLSKYEGMELPGGVHVNGSIIKQEAAQEIQLLEQELERIEGILPFMVG